LFCVKLNLLKNVGYKLVLGRCSIFGWNRLYKPKIEPVEGGEEEGHYA
jgi:hypothetical protein